MGVHPGWLQIPHLTSDGQRQFWDRQVGYAKAQMTTDNGGELSIVGHLCDEIIRQDKPIHDVVTLGGAVGCRDPDFVLQRLSEKGVRPQEVWFNDLSQKLAEQASAGVLQKWRAEGVTVHVRPGKIVDVIGNMPKRPRRVIIGLNAGSAFLTAQPDKGFADDGLTGYLANEETLGDSMCIECLKIVDGRWVALNVRALCGRGLKIDPREVRQFLDFAEKDDGRLDPGAIRIIAWHFGVPGFFLSHWYTPGGALDLVKAGFGDRAASVRIFRCAKGMVLCVDPVDPPQGIVTLLNNVIGNTLPEEQLPSLRAIHENTA